MAFWNWENKKEIDFVEDNYNILKEAREVTQSLNNNNLLLISENDITDLDIIVSVVNGYLTMTTYLFSVVSDSNVGFTTSRVIYKRLTDRVFNYFKSKRFDTNLFSKTKNGYPLVLPVILKDLYSFDVELFIKLLKKHKELNKTVTEYNKNILNISDEYKGTLNITQEQFTLTELLEQEWFYNSVYSTVKIFVKETLNNDDTIVVKIINLLDNYFKETISKQEIYTFLLAINNKEFLKDCFELTKIKESIKFNKLNYSQQEEVLTKVVPKLISTVLENMEKETEQIKEDFIKDVDNLF